jgi:hypothetical protein
MKYKKPYLTRIYIYLAAVLLLSGCTTEIRMMTLKASVDFANTHEAGPSQLTYNPKTGVNMVVYDQYYFDHNNSSWSDSREEFDSVVKHIPTPGFGIGAGLEFVMKGAKEQDIDGTIGLNYLEIPIHLLYHYPLSSGELYAGFGPYLAYGVGGTIKSQGFSEKSFGEDNGGYKPFDFGLGIMAGYKLPSGFSLDVSYEYGLANIAYASDDVTSHNRVFSINLGYQIGRLFNK